MLKQFGSNVLASEGAEWKLHRRVLSAAFSEKNAALVFTVSGEQTRGLVEKWMADQGAGRPVETIDKDTMKLALNIIAYVGFGLKLLWPGQRLPEGTDARLYKYTALEPAGGHTMSFAGAVAGMLDTLLLLLIVPEWLLRECPLLPLLNSVLTPPGRIPLKRAQFAAESHRNYLTYMRELVDEKAEQLSHGKDLAAGMDIMGHLVRSTYTSPAPAATEMKPEAEPEAEDRLSRSDIIGNAFIVLVAGHETTANALQFTLLELAAHPSAQRAVQRDLDRILGRDTDPKAWCYEESIGPLLGSMLGACMSETLRKLPAVVEIPKRVDGGEAGGQVVTMDGEARVLPGGAKISLVAVAAHRNPRYWPTRRSRISGKEHDLDDYVPERWFRKAPGGCEDGAPETPMSSVSGDSVFSRADDGETPESSVAGEDDGGSLFRPEKGAY
ncbi:MAG: cytochrome P450, partial [Acidobacteria bacterium]|nr:cytochrome P450 [Acidobacteriota bacterium]